MERTGLVGRYDILSNYDFPAACINEHDDLCNQQRTFLYQRTVNFPSSFAGSPHFDSGFSILVKTTSEKRMNKSGECCGVCLLSCK